MPAPPPFRTSELPAVSSPAAPDRRSGLTAVQWLVCVIAAIGFAFDIYELLMAPLVFPDAIRELTGASPTDPKTRGLFLAWVGWLFFFPAFAGGLFGMVGGYLTDRLGRRRVLTFSILLYAASAFLAGFSTNIWTLLVLRCTTFVGVCVEFVAAVAWLAELFDDPRRREQVLGYTQAFSSIGGFLVAVAYGVCSAYAESLPGVRVPEFLAGTFGQIGDVSQHAAWRYTLMSGLVPAIPLILIRPFLPESPKWQAKKNAGTLRRPSFGELFGTPRLRNVTVVTTLMFACSYGAAFGAIQQIQHILPGLPEVKRASDEAGERVRTGDASAAKPLPAPKLAVAVKKAERGAFERIKSKVTTVQEVGGLIGRFLLAVIVVYFVSRRALLRVFLAPGLIVLPLTFAYAATTDLTWTYVGMFLSGLLTVAQFSFWGNYLPQVYPLHLRGTGESFAANIGGRMIGTGFAWVTTTLAASSFMPGAEGPERTAYTAAIIAFGVYLANLVLSVFLPEPDRDIDEEETIGHAEASPLIPATVQPKKV
jgi:MFS family permease